MSALFKKGSRELPGNYRPVSLTSHVGKVLESMLRDVIVDHLLRYKLINTSQHGFVKGRSCETNLLEYFEEVTEFVDKGEPADVIYLDFQKAFDKVPHQRLLKKMRALGIDGEIYNWIEDWLTDRLQRVCLAGESSSWTRVTSGVPQGSVLGPLLFLIYINDIDQKIVSRILKFADDTKLYSRAGSDEDIDKLRRDLRSLVDWSKDWLMMFNVEKCKVMHVGYSNRRAEYIMDGRKLQDIEEELDLGVIVQSDLKCAKHCAKVVGTANRELGMIKRTFHNFSKEIIVKLYKCFVRPHLEYAVQAWRPHLRKDIELLEGVQRRATRMVVDIKGMGYEERLKLLGLTTLETRRIRGDLIEVYRIMKGFDDIDANKLFVRAGG